MAKSVYEVETFDTMDKDSMLTIAKSLGSGVSKPSKFVSGFLVAAVEAIQQHGNKTPLATFLSFLSEKDSQIVAKLCGILSGKDNEGKAYLQITNSKKNGLTLKWPGHWRNGSLNEEAVLVLMDAHSKHDFRSKAIHDALFPKRVTTTEYDPKKYVTAIEKALAQIAKNEPNLAPQALRNRIEPMIAEAIAQLQANAA